MIKMFSAAANKSDGVPLNKLWYGVKFTPGQSNPQCVQVAGDESLLVLKPVHNKIRHAVVNDDRTVNHWLDQYQLSKYADGSASRLDGSQGQVMGLIPRHYRKMWYDGGNEIWAVSQYPLEGFTEVPARWIGTFPGTIDEDDKLESVAGKFALTNRTPVQYLGYARNRGAEWYNTTYQAIFDLYVLYLIEFANFDFQAALCAGLTNANSTDWSNYNSYYPLYENGSDADEIVSNGETSLFIENFVGGTGTLNTQVAVYRQFRLLTGIWEWLSGINIHNSVEDGSRVYLCDVPASLGYDTETGHSLFGNIVETDGYIKEMLPFSILPKVVGASGSTYYSDYHYSYYDNSPSSGWRAALWFGGAYLGANAGLAFSNFYHSSGSASAHAGSRLCSFANL